MAKIEVEESEFQNLQRVATVATAIGKDPERRRRLQELAAEAMPDEAGDLPIIRREIATFQQTIRDELKADREARAKKEDEEAATRATRDLEQKWVSGRSRLREDGYTDEGLEKLEGWMEKHGVADHKIAAAAYERENPPPPPVETGGSSWNFFDQRDNPESGLEMLLKGDDEAFLRKQIDTSLKEVRGQR